MKIKEMFKNAKERMKESKIVNFIKTIFNKVFKKPVEYVGEKSTTVKENLNEFLNTHNNIKDAPTGIVMERFSGKVKKLFKKFCEKLETKSDSGSKFATFWVYAIKAIAIVCTIAFIGLVIYCIKDVFMHCVMLVATCAAVIICIEFILKMITIATGVRI